MLPLAPRTSGCIKCGACNMVCPVASREGISRFTGPRNLAVDVPRFLQELGESRDNLLMCTTCWRCEEVCPACLPLPDVMLEMRRMIHSPDVLLEGHRRIVENIDRFGRSVEPGEVLSRPQSRTKGEVMYFPGCIGELRITEMFESSVSVLEKLKVDFGVPESWVCCGAPLEKIGDEKRMNDLVEANLLRFEGFGDIVTSCPGCTTQLLIHYGLEPLHTIEFMRENSSLRRPRFKGVRKRKKVTLHHPCHLARTIGPQIIEYAYELLQSVPGIKLVEMEDPGACCGGGGGVVAGYPDIALHLAMEKMADVERVGAELVLAPCPFCVLNLGRVGGSRVQELVSFLNAHLE